MIALATAALLLGLGGQTQVEACPGQLTIIKKDGAVAGLCPLKGTDVEASITGFGARVNVTQTFTNPTEEPIEAVYTFPLSDSGAVDRMRMQVGDRVVEGVIKPRDEARQIYNAAKSQGQVASLLDQERPNIFTQNVANIMPGAKVKVQISYVELIKYEDGQFDFSFPMTVGPRYLGNTPDPGKISPPITPKGTRTGADIHVTVHLDAGTPILDMHSVLHQVSIQKIDDSHETITLANKEEIPNRDFMLKYRTAGDTVKTAFLTQMDANGKGGFFTLLLTPPKMPRESQIAPREIIFVMDQSGSQNGFPIEKGKELIKKLVHTLRPGDTFDILGFNTIVKTLWTAPRPTSAENVRQANDFIAPMQGDGGTDIRAGIVAALGIKPDPKRVRLVVIETDGFIGDEPEILDSIQKHRGTARIFTFGIGNSVNRYLIDAMSVEGKGDAEYVTLSDSADAAVDRFVNRTETPILTKISANFEGVAVQDVLPSAIPDVFNQRPIALYGRFSEPGNGQVTITGQLGSESWSKTLDLRFTNNANAGALPSLWARRKIDEITALSYGKPIDVQPEITQVALDFGIMSQYTSFVAVEPRVVNIGGKSRTVHVPVEMADGVSYDETLKDSNLAVSGRFQQAARGGGSFGGGTGGTTGGSTGGIGGVIAGVPPSTFTSTRSHKVSILHADPQGFVPPNPENKISHKLKAAKGKVEIQIWLTTVSPEILKVLEKAGFHLDVKDDKLKIAFGTCDASALKEIVKLDEVQRIEALGD
jgi:Ca-activated chloride channel family protein